MNETIVIIKSDGGSIQNEKIKEFKKITYLAS